MSINERAALSPEMLLFEIAAMCSRHGLAIPANANPAAARHYAERLMHALGLVDDAPAGVLTSTPAPDVTTPLPIIRDGAFAPEPPERPWPLPLRGPRGAHRVSRPLSSVPGVPDGDH